MNKRGRYDLSYGCENIKKNLYCNCGEAAMKSMV